MKTGLLAVLIFTSCSQKTNFVISELPTGSQPFEYQANLPEVLKAPAGLSWVLPIDEKYNVGGLIDSIYPDLVSATKYYFDKNLLEADTSVTNMGFLWEMYNAYYKADVQNLLQPFLIKNHEVTNLEYREFVHFMGPKNYESLRPDTTVWDTDFSHAYNEPMRRMYYGHPAYDDYPVVGVNFYQAEKFCTWMQDIYRSRYQLEDYEIVVSLPNQFEWAFASGDGYYVTGGDRKAAWNKSSYFDYSHITGLLLNDTNGMRKLLDRTLLPGYSNISLSPFMVDGYLYTNACNSDTKLVKSNFPTDQVGSVKYLNTNVSEWCSESYAENWKDLYETRQEMLRCSNTREGKLVAEIEAYYNQFNDTVSGRLVRGGNWFHEQHAYRQGYNVGSQDLKLFVHPNEAHSTLGFRYVVRLVPKEQVVQKKP